MNDVVCAVCGRTVTVDENTTTCASCGAPLALPIQQEPAVSSADSAAPAVPAGDPTDSAEVQAIPVAEVAGESSAAATGVQVDTSMAGTPDTQDEPVLVAAEVVEVFTPAGDASDGFASYAADGGSQNGAPTFADVDGFEPVAVAYETVSYEAPSADAYVPPVPMTTESEQGASSEAAADAPDAEIEAWQTPAVVLDAIGVDTATGDVVEVVEVFAAEPAPVEEVPAAAPVPVASAPETPVAPASAAPAPTPAAPAPMPAAPKAFAATSSAPARETGGSAALIALLVLVVLAAVVICVLYFAGIVTF